MAFSACFFFYSFNFLVFLFFPFSAGEQADQDGTSGMNLGNVSYVHLHTTEPICLFYMFLL